MLLAHFFELPRYIKRLIMLISDIVFIALAVSMTQMLVTHQWMPHRFTFDNWLILDVLLISIPTFAVLGLYHAIVRFMGEKALLAVLQGTVIAALAYGSCALLQQEPISLVHIIVFWTLLFIFVGGSRFAVRHTIHASHNRHRQSIIIYGAGNTGTQLLKALQGGKNYQTLAFLDDRTALQGSVIDGIKVYSPETLSLLIERQTVQQIFLAMPSISRARKQHIINSLEKYAIHVKTIPNLADIMTGKASIQEVRDIEIEDLLGRDAIEANQTLLDSCIAGKIVLVTGAGGSIGSELCRQILKQAPKKLLLLDSNEYGLYAIEKELIAHQVEIASTTKILSFLASVQDRNSLDRIFSTFRIDTVYHAAAYKHVPMVECNIIEGIKNNIFGTLYTAEAAKKYQVSTFLLISTDKAVRPTNIMGTTKRMAELILQAQISTPAKTIFSMVRFGNVLGSSGSVVPLFREQINMGGPVTVTHPEVIRYFMTVQEAAQLVIQASAMAQGGDVFILDMGEPVKIHDLAKKMIRLMGCEVKNSANPDGDIEIQYTGLRPGEKLFEELLIGDNPIGTSHPRIMRAEETHLSWEELQALLQELEQACQLNDCKRIQQLLLNGQTGYTPIGEISDHIWQVSAQKIAASHSNVVSVLKMSQTNPTLNQR